MIAPGKIAEILATYQKHGWVIRRVLLSGGEAGAAAADILAQLPADVNVITSDIDAAWFSRPPTGSSVAWEIRYLGEPPFALLETIDESAPSLEADLGSVESRLRDAVAVKRTA